MKIMNNVSSMATPTCTTPNCTTLTQTTLMQELSVWKLSWVEIVIAEIIRGDHFPVESCQKWELSALVQILKVQFKSFRKNIVFIEKNGYE